MENDAAAIKLVAFARGDRAALRPLYEEFGPALYGYLLAASGNREDALDLLQDVFLWIFQHAGELADLESPLGYLVQVGRRLALQRKKSADSARPRGEVRRGAETCLLQIPAAADPSEALQRREEAARLEAAWMSLADFRREIVQLHVHMGMTFQETAAILGMPMSKVVYHYQTALQHMKARLDA